MTNKYYIHGQGNQKVMQRWAATKEQALRYAEDVAQQMEGVPIYVERRIAQVIYQRPPTPVLTTTTTPDDDDV